MRYFILSGEASGDLHGANLVKGLKSVDSQASFSGWGGNLMKEEGVQILKHISELAFMGFVEVLQNIRTIKKNFALCKKQISDYKPDAVIMVDYPGFNMRMSKWIREQNIPVYYYISPNVWAWNQKRVFHFRDHVNQLYVILPFEQEFYKKYGIEVEYQGHPIQDAMAQFSPLSFDEFCSKYSLNNKPKIAVLAGSRKQEIKQMLHYMLAVAKDFPDYEFIIAGSNSIDKALYNSYMLDGVKLIVDDTYNVLQHAEAGIIKSGTSTLEAALLDVPQVVCYRTSIISSAIVYLVAKVKFVSLVNLILNRESVAELLQYKMNTKNIGVELSKIISGGTERKRILNDYSILKNMLGPKNATQRVAEKIYLNLSDAKK